MFCENGGCMAKVSGERLIKLISHAKGKANLNDSIDLNSICQGRVEDCAAIKIDSSTILYSTDFGPLVGDDPYIAGKIAALNALSDIYATGGKPEYALVIISLNKSISDDAAERLLEGVYCTCKEEKVSVVGGHSIQGEETLIGLSVIGSSPYGRILGKHGGRVGDKIWISKPLGTGLVLRGYYHKILGKTDYDEAIRVILQTNFISSEIVESSDIHAMTDITGYGLIGHLTEMLDDNQGALIKLSDVPFLSSLSKLSLVATKSDYILNNYHYSSNNRRIMLHPKSVEELALFDPQTNGGLIIITSPDMLLPKTNYYCIGEITKSHEIYIV